MTNLLTTRFSAGKAKKENRTLVLNNSPEELVGAVNTPSIRRIIRGEYIALAVNNCYNRRK
jgi:hypothetical protein